MRKLIKQKILFLIAPISMLFLTGCGTAIDNLNVFQQDLIEKAELMPSQKALNGDKLKVVVMSVEDSSFKLAKSANLGAALTRMIETEIGRDQAIDILDRSVAKKFENEMKLNELNGLDSEDNALVSSADYIVVGELKNASFSSRFVARSSWVDKEGKRHVTPSYYVYSANVGGQIKIFELPSNKIKKIISFSDYARRSEDSRFLGERVKVDHGLLNEAGEGAIHLARIELKNFLAPKGYLIGARSYDGDRIVKISLGLNNGLKEGDAIEIITKKKIINQITEEVEIESHKIAFATVSDKIQERSAWAHLDEIAEGETVHLGDEVRVIYSKGFSDYMSDTGNFLNKLSR